MQTNRGSTWRKWDFHIHTPASFSWQSGNSDDIYKQIIEKMNLSDVDAYVITDYWTFDGYKKIIEVNEGLPADQQLKKVIFPGIELRYDVLTDETPQRRVNFQLVVDNSGTKEEVAQRLDQIIHRIRLSGTEKLISDQSFIELARDYSDDMLQSLVNKNCANCSEADLLRAGKMHCYVDFEAMRKHLFEDSEVNESFMLIGPWDKYGGIAQIDKILRSDVTKKLLKKTDFVESSVINTEKLFQVDRDYLKGKAFGDRWKRFLNNDVKACVCGSDQKSIERFGEFPNNIATWVKAEVSFEGLRQGIFEPRYRIKLSTGKPPDPITTISNVALTFPGETIRGSDKFCFAGEEYSIVFSPNLTCIIGGRGTGKSTLLELLNFSLNGDPGNSINDIEIPSNTYIDDYIAIDDEDSTKAAEFLSQNRIESFATDEIEFTKAIRLRLHKLASDDGIDEKIEAMNTADDLAKLQVDRVRSRRQAELRRAKLEKDLKAEKNILQSVSDPEYVRLSKDLTAKINEHKKYLRYADRVRGITGSIEEIEAQYVLPLEKEGNEYSAKINDAFAKLKDAKDKLREVDLTKLQQETENADKLVNDARIAIRDYFAGKGLSREDLSDLSNASKKIAEFQAKIIEEQKLLDEIDKDIEAYDITDLSTSALVYRETIESQIIPINKELSSLSSEVKPIELKYTFDQGRARNQLLENINREFNLQLRKDHLHDFFPAVTSEKIGTKSEFIQEIRATNEPLNSTQTKLIELFDVDENFAILEIMLARVFENELLHGTIEVTYDGKSLMDSSFGQRCTAAIVVLLYLGNNPIIIDEPEAHLDSGLIANYLVDLIKKRKQSRQIIFATHNANFVINGDAELVLILTNDEGSTKIVPTTIENVETKLDLMKLEGSKDAFRIRQGKYNLSIM